MDSDTDGSGGALPNPILSLKLYRRCFKGRKQLFSQSDDAAANYFITNPVPHKHSNCWRPIFYRGDNPKFTPDATAIGRARRSAMWGTFRVWLGDGVQEVLDNKKRRQERRKAERKNKWRKIFGKKKRPVDVEEKEVQGMVVMFRMQRTGFLTRSLELEVQGVRYRWSGTRMFATGFMKRFKGWSHSMKVSDQHDSLCVLLVHFTHPTIAVAHSHVRPRTHCNIRKRSDRVSEIDQDRWPPEQIEESPRKSSDLRLSR